MEGEKEEEPLPRHNAHVSSEVRAKADGWLARVREQILDLDQSWIEPTRIETDLGEVLFEWRRGGLRHEKEFKEVSVSVDEQEVWYMRVDNDEARDMPDGDAQYCYDTFRLLWYWLWH